MIGADKNENENENIEILGNSITKYKNQKWLNFGKASYLAWAFFILFIAFFSV